MSWKGFQKAMSRLPHLVMKKTGGVDETVDEEFNRLEEIFNRNEEGLKRFVENIRKYKSAISNILGHQQGFMEVFIELIQLDEAEGGNKVAEQASQLLHKQLEMKKQVLTLIEESLDTKVLLSLEEYLKILDKVKLRVTKRNHRLLDYDRHRLSLKKLSEAKDKTPADEKKLVKLEQTFEAASHDFNTINDQLKSEMPQLLAYQNALVNPCFNYLFTLQYSFYKLNCELFKVINPKNPPQITEIYNQRKALAFSLLEEISVISFTPHSGSITPDSSSRKTNESIYPSIETSTVQTKTTAAKTTPSAISQNAPTNSPLSKPVASFATLNQKPIKYVIALYDYEAQADGDLSFTANEKIELVQKTQFTNDWWTGKLNGRVGIFPGNYVKEL